VRSQSSSPIRAEDPNALVTVRKNDHFDLAPILTRWDNNAELTTNTGSARCCTASSTRSWTAISAPFTYSMSRLNYAGRCWSGRASLSRHVAAVGCELAE
jgi:hypothetical protein